MNLRRGQVISMSKRPPMTGMKSKAKKGTLKRLLKLLLSEYKWQLLIVFICIVVSTAASTASSLFLNQFISKIEEGMETGWGAAAAGILRLIGFMGLIYLAGVVASFFHARIMAIVTQSFLNSTRKKMFSCMERLPIRYFDTHPYGDVMSYYTNDIDTLRQLVSQALPSLIMSAFTLIFLVSYMFYLSLWMTLVVFGSVILMFVAIKLVGGNSGKYFLRQ